MPQRLKLVWDHLGELLAKRRASEYAYKVELRNLSGWISQVVWWHLWTCARSRLARIKLKARFSRSAEISHATCPNRPCHFVQRSTKCEDRDVPTFQFLLSFETGPLSCAAVHHEPISTLTLQLECIPSWAVGGTSESCARRSRPRTLPARGKLAEEIQVEFWDDEAYSLCHIRSCASLKALRVHTIYSLDRTCLNYH